MVKFLQALALLGLLSHQSCATYVCEKTSSFTCRLALSSDTTPGSEIVPTDMCWRARNTERGQSKQYICNFEQKNNNCETECDEEQCLEIYIPCRKQKYKMRVINACGPIFLQYELDRIYKQNISINSVCTNRCAGLPYNELITRIS